MLIKKLLQLFVLIVFTAGILHAQNGQLAKVKGGWLYEIPKTTIAPVIDGKQDAVWKTLDWNLQTSYGNGEKLPDSWADLFGASKLMWDDDNLYGLFYAQDDIIVDVHNNSWERDAIEFYTDADNSKGASYDNKDDIHLAFRHEFIDNEAANVQNKNINAAGLTKFDGIEFKILDDTTSMGGYWLEFKIPLENLLIPPVAGTLIGIEWQQNDNDGDHREHISKWWLQQGDNSWLEPRLFGTAVLSDRVVSDKFEIQKLPAGTTITIDGELDEIYSQLNNITQNSHGNGEKFPDDLHDAFVRTYLAYDDENIYGICIAYDDVIIDVHNNSWERDAVELYFDADNSKGASYDNKDDIHLAFRHEFIGNEAGNLNNINAAGLKKFDGIEFKIVDTDLGYNVEFKIPLENLLIPAVEGTVIGLEVQQNDNDGDHRESINKWWLENGDNSWLEPRLFGTAVLGAPLVVGVQEKSHPIVTDYRLEQNYPNPFNPTTQITFSIPKTEKVKLAVYDILGNQVAELVNETKDAGTYTVKFNAQNLSSGVYFYQLNAGNITVARKMMLLK
ncbi:sugar-binding protein [Ignavibacteria bacterium 4148-Me]|uniref:T9SS type A sorting domain-containing protein n=1 Tax=Rosettibacter primus TaxID=3111523 RepID=UPI00336C24A4